MTGGIHARPDTTVLTDKAARFLENGPVDVVDLIGHICNLPAAPRIVAEHMARAMFAGRPEFVCDPLGRWTLVPLPPVRDIGAGERPVRRHDSEFGYSGHRRRVRKASVGMLPPQALSSLSFAVVDVETTGGAPPADRITEIGVVTVREGQVIEVFETLVNPLRPISPIVSRLTGITWGMVQSAPTFREIAPDVVRAVQGSVFVAHNLKFDWKFVSHEVNCASGVRLVGERLCTVRLARSLLPHLVRRSLDSVANYYGVEIARRHRAGGDAVATAHCLIRMLDHARDRGCETWEDLDYLLGRRAPKKKRRRYSALPQPVDKDTSA